ncbi:MAG: PAS domain S-box protein [Bacteroidetes bacterium]|nr:PAS domain S-box protein [Bacteroidota bacterium]
MTKFYHIIASLCLLFFASDIVSQDEQLKFRHLTFKDGLSVNTVYSVFQDHRGFIWMATEDGLELYNGYEFKHFKNDPNDSTSISDNFTRDICEYPEGKLWIATDGGGLNLLDLATEKFTRFTYDPGNSNSISSNEIRSLFLDNDKTIWIGTDGGGLNRLNPKTGTFEKFLFYNADSSEIINSRIWDVYADTSGALDGYEDVLWMATNRAGICLFDKKRNKFSHFTTENDLSSNNVRKFFSNPVRPNVIFVATEGGGLNKVGTDYFDSGSNRTYKLKFNSNLIKHPSLPPNISNSIWGLGYVNRGGSNYLLIGTLGDGLIFYNLLNDKVEYTFEPTSGEESISDDSIIEIFKDNRGDLWFGTDGGGVSYYGNHSKQFDHIKYNPNNSWGLNNNLIWSIIEDVNGDIWIATDGGGINIINKVTGNVVYLTSENSELPDNRISEVYEDPTQKGRIYWIGTWNNGLCRYDKKLNTFKIYSNDRNNENSLSYNLIKDIIKDNLNPDDHIYWISTGSGLNKFNAKTEEFTRYSYSKEDPASIGHNFIWQLYIDRDGDYWCATKGGLNQFFPESGKFLRYQNIPGDTTSITHNYVFNIYEDSRGHLWLGTFGGGLNRFDRKTKKFTSFREKDGLANDVVYGILEDDNGDLWVSTNLGITKVLLNPSTPHPDDILYSLKSYGSVKPIIRFRNYDVEAGLQSNEFNSGAFFKSRNGELYFGGINGVTKFNPDNIIESPFSPSIFITGFNKFNKEVKLDSSITSIQTLHLDYTDYLLNFKFAALDYSNPQKTKYAYTIEGFNDQWIDLGAKREFDLTNLDPGKYVLKIIGTNSEGIWNTEGTKLNIIISPPFWGTTWFRILFVFILSLIIWFVYSWRTKIIRTRNRILREVNSKLNDEIRSRKSAEEALIISEERFRSLFENSAFGIYRSNINGELLMANPSLLQMLEYPNPQYFNKISIERDLYLYPVMRQKFFHQLKKNGVVNGYEAFWKKNNGEVIAVREYARLIKHEETGEQYIEGAIENITEQKNAQKATLEAKDKAERSDQLKSEFLAQMSHEIRTPINTILSFSALVQDELRDTIPDYLQDSFSSINYAGRRIIRTIDMLLNMSEVQTGTYEIKLRELDLMNMVLEPVVQELSILATDKDLQLNLSRHESCKNCILNVDEYTTTQIFTNLIHNAIKYTDEGQIDIILYADDNNQIAVDIKDTGIGISDEYKEIIFSPFTQEEQGYTRRFEGTGLGLALVKQYCKLNKAEINLISEKNKGSVFTVAFTEQA